MSRSLTPRAFGAPALLLLAAAGAAHAQFCTNGVDTAQCTPVGTCNGPDLIVGDITGVANYASSGTIDAFSLGTTLCNIGNAGVTYNPNNAQHPVFGQAIYKLKTHAAGYRTFEQLGQSWLQHGFFALSNAFCCTGCQATDGTTLGVHCSDPSTASRAGSQSGLGPKWQVNANTGAFAYPPANPSFSGSVDRRVQVKVADLEVSSATVLYFGATFCIAADESAAGNHNNNESYRRLNITGSGSEWTSTFTSATQRGQQAIRAWGDNDVSVIEADLQVPGEGLFIVAGSATDLGGGVWHYEYAVQNLNSDRSGASFSIPLAAGITVTNIGFHDVDYHSGDGAGNINFSGTDWLASMSSGSVSDGAPLTWSSAQTHTQNPSANALRWETLYNFRFDANVPPASGAATIGLFKPGSPASVTSGATTMVVPGESTPCPADFDDDGSVEVPDIFAFLSAWFANDISADFDNSGGTAVPDIFAFLSAWFTGC